MEKKTHTKKERLYTGRGKIREKRRARGRKKPERKGKERGVIYASLGTRFYLFSPCELFYIGDLIKSNKSQHTRAHTHIHKHAHTAATAPPDSRIMNISFPYTLRINLDYGALHGTSFMLFIGLKYANRPGA